MVKLLKLAIISLVGVVLFGITLLGTALAFPSPMFPHVVQHQQISFHSDLPIPGQAETALKEIAERLERSPIKLPNNTMRLYVVNSDWKRWFLWKATSPVAGGFVIVPVTGRHAFLSGADFDRGLLISPSGNAVATPRDLAYYGAHELTHAASGELLGTVQYHLMPEWVREGIADYVAMPAERSIRELYAEVGDQDADLAMMNKYGVYAPYRLLVSFFLNEQNWSIEKVLESRMTKAEARAIMREHFAIN